MKDKEPLFPNIHVKLDGEDGNAFVIIGKISKELKRYGNVEAAKDFQEEAMSGDYTNLLQVAMKYVSVE